MIFNWLNEAICLKKWVKAPIKHPFFKIIFAFQALLLKTIIFTVTNELSFDQRMQRIAETLAVKGYRILLVGRKINGAPALQKEIFAQKRLNCPFQKGPFFYLLFNLQLFFYLLFQRADLICAIDLDTILPVYFVTLLKNLFLSNFRLI